MPSPSPGDAPTGSIADLGLPVRATTVLARAGITRIDHLATLTRRELAAVDGLGPALIAAIRRVVPEPTDTAPTVDADAEEESPATPAIPSFASLRAPQRRTALDLLVPGAPPEPGTGPVDPPPPRAPRPAEYTDLLRIGAHLVRAVAGVPARCLRWLLG